MDQVRGTFPRWKFDTARKVRLALSMLRSKRIPLRFVSFSDQTAAQAKAKVATLRERNRIYRYANEEKETARITKFEHDVYAIPVLNKPSSSTESCCISRGIFDVSFFPCAFLCGSFKNNLEVQIRNIIEKINLCGITVDVSKKSHVLKNTQNLAKNKYHPRGRRGVRGGRERRKGGHKV